MLNALQVDSRFAQAHYKLGETYLKLGDGSHAVQELSRTVDLAPDNYAAHIDLANLWVDGFAKSGWVCQRRISEAGACGTRPSPREAASESRRLPGMG